MEGEPFNITFTPTVQGTRSLTLQYPPGMTVLALKSALSPMLRNIDPFAIALIYNSTTLENRNTLAECGLHSGANVQIVINIATGGHIINQSPQDLLTNLQTRFSSMRRVVLKKKESQTQPGRATIRENAQRLIARGVAGLVLIPGNDGQKQVIELDKETLDLLKTIRAHRKRAGRRCLEPGTDQELLDAIDSALADTVADEPSMCDVELNNEPTPEDEQFSMNVKALRERIRKSAESRREAMSRALMQ